MGALKGHHDDRVIALSANIAVQLAGIGVILFACRFWQCWQPDI